MKKRRSDVVDIIGLTQDGEGVGRADGFTFCAGALPGETVRAKVLKVKKQYGYAKLLELLRQAPIARGAVSDFRQCGGCQLQHLDYAAQLLEAAACGGQPEADREAAVADAPVRRRLGDAGGAFGVVAEGVVVHPTIGMDEPWRYRNKAQVPIGMALADMADGAAAR